MDTQIAIVQFLFKQNWKVLSDSLGANPALTSHKFETAPDVLKFCSTEENCIVVANVSSKDDLIQLATFIKASRKSLKGTILKVVVVNATANKQFEKAIAKLGSVEILEPTVNVKALRFKMDFWMKAMRAQSKKLGDMTKKTLEAVGQDGTPETKFLVQVPALECENDIWILSRDTDCKRIIGRWMVKFTGPGPYVGQWSEIPNKPNIWAFHIKKAFSEQFIAGEGNWLYRGDQKPEFNWQENRWMMTGDAFELFFYDGKTSHVRAKVENRVLTIAGNSVFAKTKEPLIIDSFDKEHVFKTEADVLQDQSLEFENEGDLGGHIEGKVKERDDLGKSFLEGKLKDKEEAGKGNLEGKVKEQQEDRKGNLEGKVKEKEEPGKGNLEGKLKDREEEKSPLKGKLKSEAEEEKKEKEKHAQSNERMAGSWKGKVSDKGEEEAPLKEHKQHNEKLSNKWDGSVKENSMEPSVPVSRRKPEEASKAEREPAKNGERADRLKSHWGGKKDQNQDDLEQTDGPLSSPVNSEVKEGSLLGLKQNEKEHHTHYKNHNEAQKYEAGELGQNKYDPENPLGGKSSTDKLASHYGTGKKAKVDSDAGSDDLGGEGGTDRLASHLGGRRNLEKPESERPEKGQKPAMSGKGQTDKIRGHYGSAKKRSGDDAEALSEEIDEVIHELEDSIAGPDGGSADNVLPFVAKAEEKELDKLTESGTVVSYITQGDRRYECRLDDYFDNNIIFICSAEGLRNSEKASFDVSFAYQGEIVRVNCTGVVMSIDQDGAGSFFVTIEIPVEDTPTLEGFMDLMKSRQENIDTFLVKARGY